MPPCFFLCHFLYERLTSLFLAWQRPFSARSPLCVAAPSVDTIQDRFSSSMPIGRCESAERFRYAFPVDMVANKNKLGRRLLRLVITGGSTAMRDMPGFIIGAYSCPNPLDEKWTASALDIDEPFHTHHGLIGRHLSKRAHQRCLILRLRAIQDQGLPARIVFMEMCMRGEAMQMRREAGMTMAIERPAESRRRLRRGWLPMRMNRLGGSMQMKPQRELRL